MSESSNNNLEQAKQEGKYIRTIRSFVKREGRLTKGQAAAILALDPQVRYADLGAQAVHRLERCRKMPKGRPRVRRDQVLGWIVKLHGRPVHRKL